VSVFFDLCADVGPDSGGCRGLAWERAHMSNGKYMCWAAGPVMTWAGIIALTGVVSHGLCKGMAILWCL
jgi:hypothetical protein